MHQSGEREEQEDGHSKHQMNAEYKGDTIKMRRCTALESDNALRPAHQLHHFTAVRMLC